MFDRGTEGDEGAEGAGRAKVIVSLRIRRVEPLAGSATIEGRAPRAFDGWMELIGVVAELLGSPNGPGEPLEG